MRAKHGTDGAIAERHGAAERTVRHVARRSVKNTNRITTGELKRVTGRYSINCGETDGNCIV
ncbi:MAG: hypothetical protein ACK55I_28225, partial [bacterium]